MIFVMRASRLAIPTGLLAAIVVLAGCGPGSNQGADEQRETHFVNGRARLQARDFPGAVESFERALEVNPRNASAHFELALLLGDQERFKDWAGAIYHFERYLRYTRDSAQAHTASNHIVACKQYLAQGADFGQVARTVSDRLAVLTADKARLEQRVAQLEELLAQRNAAAAVPAAQRNQNPAPGLNPPGSAPAPARNDPAPAAPKNRTHTVAAGETPTAIARRYGVKLDRFMAANPGLDPSRMRAGQKVNIPAP